MQQPSLRPLLASATLVLALCGTGMAAAQTAQTAPQDTTVATQTDALSAPEPAAAPADPATASEPAAAPQIAIDPITPAPAAESGLMDSFGIGRDALPHDLSPWGMFLNADIVVKAVMIGLAFASVVTWTILIVKLFEIAAANRNARRSAELIARAPDLREAVSSSQSRRDPASRMLRAAAAELERSGPVLDSAGVDGLKERVASFLSSIVAFSGRRAGIGTGVLATIGSTAPFVGLFGTVWGIMNSFIGISESQTTNLAVVAPGIAEALLATALGLVAAIPAVVIYNFFARQITGYRLRLSEAAAGVERLVSRDLDFRNGRGM